MATPNTQPPFNPYNPSTPIPDGSANSYSMLSPTQAEAALTMADYIYFLAIGGLILSGFAIIMKGKLLEVFLKAFPSLGQFVLYIILGNLCYWPKFWFPNYSHIFVTPFSAAFTGVMLWSLLDINKALIKAAGAGAGADDNDDTNAKRRAARARARSESNVTRMWFAVCTMFYCVLGLHLESETMGYLMTISFMSFAGFVFNFVPGMVSVGYDNSMSVPTGAIASAITVGAALFVESIYHKNAAAYVGGSDLSSSEMRIIAAHELFVPGMIWIGSLVYFITVLIMSSYRYASEFKDEQKMAVYFWSQILAIGTGGAAIWYGVIYDLGQLLWMSKIITTFYFAEKLYEITPNGTGMHVTFAVCAMMIMFITHLKEFYELDTIGL